MAMSAEELLAGAGLTHGVDLPADLLAPGGDGPEPRAPVESRVELRPLTVRSLQKISRAARDDEQLSAALMIQQALVEPALKLDQVSRLSAGLARFLVEKINEISGISTPRDELEELVQAPLARACFVLAREFGWTPEEVSGMTLGQVLLYVEMARGKGEES